MELHDEALNKMTTALEVMATKQTLMNSKVDSIEDKIAKLESAPVDDYRHYKRLIIGCIITTLLGAVLGLLIGRFI